jgi:hypothetical protein
MMKIKYYITSALSGAFFGFWGYLIFLTMEDRDYNSLLATAAAAMGLSLGISTILFLKKKRPQIYRSPSLSIWTATVLNFNLFFGIILGYVGGISASWIFFLIFSMIFGHPESATWDRGLSYVFLSIAVGIFACSFLFIARWIFMGGIIYFEKKFRT